MGTYPYLDRWKVDEGIFAQLKERTRPRMGAPAGPHIEFPDEWEPYDTSEYIRRLDFDDVLYDLEGALIHSDVISDDDILDGKPIKSDDIRLLLLSLKGSSDREDMIFWYQALHSNGECIYALIDGYFPLSGEIDYFASEADMVKYIEGSCITYEDALDTLLKHQGLKK